MKDDHFDQYLNAAVSLPSEDKMQTGKVTRRKMNKHGKPTGVAHENSMLDTRGYIV